MKLGREATVETRKPKASVESRERSDRKNKRGGTPWRRLPRLSVWVSRWTIVLRELKPFVSRKHSGCGAVSASGCFNRASETVHFLGDNRFAACPGRVSVGYMFVLYAC